MSEALSRMAARLVAGGQVFDLGADEGRRRLRGAVAAALQEGTGRSVYVATGQGVESAVFRCLKRTLTGAPVELGGSPRLLAVGRLERWRGPGGPAKGFPGFEKYPFWRVLVTLAGLALFFLGLPALIESRG